MIDIWDLVVGIPLDLWIKASTVAEVEILIERRKAGEFPLKPPPPEPCSKCGSIACFTEGVYEPIQYLCICPDPSLIGTVWR